MKDKILVFIIGLLVGATITASGFLIYQIVNRNTNQIPNEEKIQMMERSDGEEPPEKPSGTENDTNRPAPPSKNNSLKSNSAN